MDPVQFEGANCVLKSPVTSNGIELNKEEKLKIEDLYVLKCVFGDSKIPAFISCWELSDADVDRILKTRRVWCTVLTGGAAPPISLQTHRPFDLKELR